MNQGKERPLSCNAIANLIEFHIGYRPHATTVRRICEEHLVEDDDFLPLTRRFLVYPHAVQMVIVHMKRKE